MRQRQPKQALDAAKDAQAQAPDDPHALQALAQSHIAVGNGDTARSVLRRLAQVVTFHPGWLTQAAALQMQAGDVEAARYTLSKALLADAAYAPAVMQQIRLELQSGKIAEAEKQAHALLSQAGSGADAQRLMGEIRMSQKRHTEAVAAYRDAYAREPIEPGVFGLFDALMANGQAADAATLMTGWRTRYPQNRLAAHALGEAWLALKDATRARTVYADLVRTDPKDARARNNLAHVLLQLGDPAALAHAEQARKLAPNQPQVNHTLGWVLVQQGQPEKGLRYLREAALRTLDNQEIQDHIKQTQAIISRR